MFKFRSLNYTNMMTSCSDYYDGDHQQRSERGTAFEVGMPSGGASDRADFPIARGHTCTEKPGAS